ncbi:MAG: DUF2088 domain-containing protein [Lachnospiraceae bacterium]|nr:DUF2088 domain-containing protein [Lachnospiraceae bacterium]
MFIDFPESHVVVQGIEKIKVPKLAKMRQIYDAEKIEDLGVHVRREMEKTLKEIPDVREKRLCITAGSRGIPDLALIIRTVCEELKRAGAKPFIIPAMGSHGGGTAQGQKEYLEGFGITEESMGVPILSSMEVVKYGELDDGTDLYVDKYAWESDGIIVLNKVKPHTDFRGRHESGMAKMIAIGLAKHVGAASFHTRGFASFAERIPKVCNVFLEKCPVAFGVAVVQNAYDHISELEIMVPGKIMERDAALLEIAKRKVAGFKYPHIDVLVIDEIGKNISGNGHDPNVTGRNNSGLPGFKEVLDLKKLFIRGLNKETHHNACGLACADVTTVRCLRDVDWDTTWTNVASCTQLNGAYIPMYMNNDEDALKLAIKTLNGIDYEKAKVVRIKDTLHMGEIEVSKSYWEEAKQVEGVELISEFREISFDEEGYMI